MQTVDQQLIETYVRDKSEGAFRQIVERYGQLVYSAAYRRLRDHHLAEDASQATFIILARKAHRLGPKIMLGGWLWRTATFCARNLARQRVAREHREQSAEPAGQSDGEALWERLAPELDAALETLSARNRETLVAHYLLEKPRQEVAREFGVHIDTVNKRIQSGLEKLRRALTRRGVAVSSGLLAAALTERAAEAVSVATLDAMHSMAYGTLTGATALTSAPCVLAKGVMRMMAWQKIRLTAAYAGAILVVCGLTAAVATMSGLVSNEYRLPEEPRYVPLEYPREVLEAPSGFILDFHPAAWGEQDLSGVWKFKGFQIERGASEAEDPGLNARYFEPAVPTDGWSDIPVPYSLGQHEAATPAKGRYFKGVAWYRRPFGIPAAWHARIAQNWRVLLRFEALRYSGDAWINGKPAGEHMSGLSAFQFDVTEQVRTDSENVLAVRVVAGGSNYQGRSRDGLWQPVRLLCVPPTYARHVLVATELDPPALRIKAQILHHGEAGESMLNAQLEPYSVKAGRPSAGRASTRTFPLGMVALKPGLNEVDFRVKTPGVQPWSPEAPNLYLLSIRAGDMELGRERIGFRTFAAKDGHFYLNGNKVKLMGFQLGGGKNIKAPGTWCCNADNHARKLLWGLKQANVNFCRPHNGADGGLPKTMYNVCDELGILIYDEYIRVHARLYDPEKLAERGREYTEWVLQTHNHPACVMWDFGGNEIYTGDMEMIPVFNYLYALLDNLDLQKRPKTASSGRLTWKRLARSAELEKSDFADSHAYTGYFHGSYQDFIEQFQRHREEAVKRYGAVPTINCEWGWPGDTARYRANTRDIRALYQKQPWGKPEKEQWIEWIQSKTPEIGDYMRSKANWAGGRMWSCEPFGLWEQKAEFAKRFFEVFRRAGDTLDGGHFNTAWYDLLMLPGRSGGLNQAVQHMGLTPRWDREQRDFTVTPAYYVWRRVYSPTFICLDIYDKNTFAGRTWQGTVHLMNDTHEDAGPARAVVQVRDPQRRLIHQECFWQGRLAPYARTTVPLAVSLPGTWPSGTYALELYLLGRRDAHLSDNTYPLNVLNGRDLFARIQTKAKVGLYEVAANGNGAARAATTQAILDSLAVPYAKVTDFKHLNGLQVLVIGRHSFDLNLAEHGTAIAQWIRAGGRVLCFEQNKAGEIPFLPEVKVQPGKNGSFTELLVEQHPIFTGLAQPHFDDWTGDRGLLYKNVLDPLNEGMLSVGPTTRFGEDNIKMVTAAYRIGKGEALLSQYELTERYGRDSIATRFAQNLLAYVLAQPASALSLPFDSKATAHKRIHVPETQACYVDIRQAANGDLDEFRGLPRGLTKLAGDVPFRIIDPERNKGCGCIELGGRQRADAPRRTPPIPVGARCSKLYLLHYATYAGAFPEGEVLYTLHIRYADGAEQSVPLRNGLETADWWGASDQQNATVVFTEGNMNLFLTEIAPNRPNAAIQSIRFESAGKANPTILGVTGRTAG
ncbi:MAG: sigma-70 family RNA polymerase sigma factor [Kiritimatiellae bacterium]|nr:sigma-70 family RNA polymerase sigma factor [Kiritimatiellia bacterium]